MPGVMHHINYRPSAAGSSQTLESGKMKGATSMGICIPLSRMRLTVAVASLLAFQSALSRADQSPPSQEQVRLARLRLLCATVFGGDITNPFGMMMFRRCLQDPESMLRPRHPVNLPPLVNPSPVPLVRPGAPRPAAEGPDQPNAAPGSSQGSSASRQTPRPLAAGINKGNIDSNEGTRSYYFWAGPGHIEVRLAFKEMGVLGAPLRQALTFDFVDENGRMRSHNAVVSDTGLQTIKTSGDLASRQKL